MEVYNVYDLKPFEKAVKKVDRKFIFMALITTVICLAQNGKIAKLKEQIEKIEKEHTGAEGE